MDSCLGMDLFVIYVEFFLLCVIQQTEQNQKSFIKQFEALCILQHCTRNTA
jgi:hypothetical protein